MYYQSTRSTQKHGVTASYAIKEGLAPDGGLYMPSEIPHITYEKITELCDKSYPERAAFVLSEFLDDYTYDELLNYCNEAYCEKSFPGGAAQLKKLNDNIYPLELWHGPTCAFKDMALQIMPKLLSAALKKNNEKRTALILVATSGDTGKAALEGYKNIPGIKIAVFYPVNGVSRVQKLQMATQCGENVAVYAINGNFDDAQSGVKKIFSDKKIADRLNENGVFLSSANSINWGRLAPQIAYYVSAYCDLLNRGEIQLGDKTDICVPSGNFGNIFAAYIAKRMGMPFGKFICASNRNNVLTDFLTTGTYDRRRCFYTTISPSMDILISSNLERLLYLTCGSNKTAEYMNQLQKDGKYTLLPEDFEKISAEFTGYSADEEMTRSDIASVFNTCGYLMDTHTSVGYSAAERYIAENPSAKVILASTASPYKFAKDVYFALCGKNCEDLAALGLLENLTNEKMPLPLSDIAERKVNFDTIISKEEMAEKIIEFSRK